MPRSRSEQMAEDIRLTSRTPATRFDEGYARESYVELDTPQRRSLSETQKMLIEQRVANEKPSTAAAYLLDIFFGPFGAHRLYLGKTGSGATMLATGFTVVGLLLTIQWALIDLFLIPSMVRRRTDEIRQKLTVEALSHG